MTREFQGEKPTIAYIRNELRNNRYVGDIFEALWFLLGEYDQVHSRLKLYTKPREYDVVCEQPSEEVRRFDCAS